MASPTLSTEQVETTLTTPDAELFREIDGLQLNERLMRWKEARRNAPWRVCTRRQQLAMESWKETEGEDIEIRRAKMLAKILASVPIDILDFDLIVGRISTGLLAATTAIDICGDYIPGLWEDDANLELNLTAKGALSAEDRQILRECTKYFAGKTAPDHIQSAWHNLVGTWSDDCVEAKLKDPAPVVGFVPGASGSLMWDRALAKGMRGFIDEAQGHIDSFLKSRDTDIRKLYFWKSAIIVCEAAIAFAHRYAELARQMAKSESNAARNRNCCKLPGYASGFPRIGPALSTRLFRPCTLLEFARTWRTPRAITPCSAVSTSTCGRILPDDFRQGNLTLERAAELLACGLGHWGSQIFIANAISRQTHQISFGINSLNVGGVDKEGKDACQFVELSCPPRHRFAEAFHSYGRFAVAQGTPRWLLDKAVDTNVKVKGGIPLFENGDYIVEYFTA